MIEMAGVGLMVEVVAHELARASESALKALESLKGKEVPEKLRAQFSSLQAEMKSISKRVRVLDPLSISGRQRAEVFVLEDLVRETCDAHEAGTARISQDKSRQSKLCPTSEGSYRPNQIRLGWRAKPARRREFRSRIINGKARGFAREVAVKMATYPFCFPALCCGLLSLFPLSNDQRVDFASTGIRF